MTIVIVHGIGRAKDGYADPLIEGIRSEFVRLKGDEAAGQALSFVEVVWDDLIADNQKLLVDRLRAGLKTPTKDSFWARVIKPITAPFKKGITWLRTDIAAEYINDIISYGNDEIYQRIHARVNERINGAVGDWSQKQPLSIVAHSLGSVVSSDYIYDQIKKNGEFHSEFTLTNFFTLGSPLALFALRFGAEAFASPVKVESTHGQWINILDRDDPFAYPLKPLNKAYHQAVEQDTEVHTGPFGVAHVKYWDDKTTHRVIAQKLVKDSQLTQ